MKKLIIYILLLLGTISMKAQCPVGGLKNSHDDSLKNRSEIPIKYKAYDFDALAHLKLYQYPPHENEFISTDGYCILVKDGGAETCNCKSKNKDDFDVHIELTKDANHTTNKDALVCEVNRYTKITMKGKGVDWSMKTLKKQMVGHNVRIGGQPFYDDHHKQNSVADSPNGTDNWRSTTLEIHPVTYIEILD